MRGEGERCSSARGLPGALLRCPSRSGGAVVSALLREGGVCGGVSVITAAVPAALHTNNSDVAKGLLGLEAIRIPWRSVLNSLSRAEGRSLRRCSQRKRS